MEVAAYLVAMETRTGTTLGSRAMRIRVIEATTPAGPNIPLCKIVSRYLVMPSGLRYDLMNSAEPASKPDLARKPRLRTAQRRAG